MSDTKLGIGVIGIGWVAHEHIKAWKNNPHVEVVALSSHSHDNLINAQRTHHLPNARLYTDWEDVIRDQRVQVVDICSMNHMHAPQAVAAAQAGKHMLIEKPASNDLAGLRQVEAAIAHTKVKSLVGFELHWSPYFESIRAMQQADFFGPVFYAECDYFSGNWQKWYPGYQWVRTKEKGGSAFPAAGCHSVDAIRQFVAGDPVEVFAYGGNFTNVMEWDATIVTLVKFSSGAIGKVGCVLEGNLKYQFNVRLHGPKGTLVNDRFLTDHIPGQTGWAQFPTILPDTPDVTHHPFQGELDHLIDSIRNDTKPLVDITDAVKTHEIVFGAEQSVREGRPVKLPLPR